MFHLQRYSLTKIIYCYTHVKIANGKIGLNQSEILTFKYIQHTWKENMILFSLEYDDIPIKTSTLNFQHRRIYKTFIKEKRIQTTISINHKLSSRYLKGLNKSISTEDDIVEC